MHKSKQCLAFGNDLPNFDNAILHWTPICSVCPGHRSLRKLCQFVIFLRQRATTEQQRVLYSNVSALKVKVCSIFTLSSLIPTLHGV